MTRAVPAAVSDAIAPLDAPFRMPKLERPQFPDRVYDITDYGAKGDGETKNTDAICKAIEACATAGGGTVRVPAGTWLTGAVHLESNVNLHLEAGAELHFSTDPEDYLPVVFTRWAGFELYNYSPLIYARDCENIAVTGAGKLFGHGPAWWPWAEIQEETARGVYRDQVLKNVPAEERVYGTPAAGLRPQFISPIRCRNVLLEGFEIAEPGPFWTIHLVYCENVIVRDLTLNTVGGPNTDGINLDSTRNALIETCEINAGDDAIALKSGINEEGRRIGRPTENVVVRNIHAGKSHGGIVIGSEMSGGVRNIYGHSCEFSGSGKGIRLKSNASRGGVVENCWFENIRMADIEREAIVIQTDYGAWMASEDGKAYPLFRDLVFKDIMCEGAAQAVSMIATEHQPIEDVTLEDVSIQAKRGMRFEWVNGITLRDVRIEPDAGNPPAVFEHCTDVEGD
ncbi:MAG: glycoside hydrolase family 28 protein [Candidatus Hydrogenedentota bacterium]